MATPNFETHYQPSPEDIYAANLALAESLDTMKAQDDNYKKRERNWKIGGTALSLAPLVAAAAFTISDLGPKINVTEIMEVDTFLIIGSGFTGVMAFDRHESTKKKALEHATAAAHVSHCLNGQIQSWIAIRLAEKQERERRSLETRGL